MKGFYFSLDSLLAASIMIGMMTFLLNFSSPEPSQSNVPELDLIDTSTVQVISNWNSSYPSSDTVIDYINEKYHRGEVSEAREVCNQYFDIEPKNSVFIGNSSGYQKICGDLSLDELENTASNSIIIPSVKVDGGLTSPKQAVLVIED